jgi:hypothetical protein
VKRQRSNSGRLKHENAYRKRKRRRKRQGENKKRITGERKAREEQERLVQQARQRQAQEEAVRTARIREKESALHALTSEIMFNPQEGLLLQFIENAVINISKEAEKEVEMERRVAYAGKKHEVYLVGLKRAALAKMMAAVEKKKRNQKVRERRKRLKEQRARMAEMQEEEQTEVPAPVQPVQTNTQPSDHSKSQRPVASSNSRRAKRTEERHRAQAAETNGDTAHNPASNSSGPKAAVQATAAPMTMSNGDSAIVGYSQSYLKAASTAPVDRTETDWFRLRAQGIDPSKYRKRSFDFTSSDEEKPKQIEAKRPKLSPPAADTQEPAPPKTELEEQRARLEAVRQSYRRSATSPSQSVNGAISVNGRSSFNDSTSSVIAKARAMLASSKAEMPPPSYINGKSTLHRSDSFDANASLLIARAKGFVPRNDTVQHDWSRSVPNLGFSPSQSQQSTYGDSTASTKDRPAYWDRVSRFVPRHLYGKGAEAVRQYRVEQGLSKSPASTRPASTEPLALSSPIPTMQSYVAPPESYAQNYTQEQYSEVDDAASGVDVIDVDVEDDNENATETEEEEMLFEHPDYNTGFHVDQQLDDEDADSESLDDELEEYDEDDEEVPESYDESEEDEDEDTQFAQPVQQQWGQPTLDKAGGTQDDAIELSD